MMAAQLIGKSPTLINSPMLTVLLTARRYVHERIKIEVGNDVGRRR